MHLLVYRVTYMENNFQYIYIAYNKPKGIICTTEKVADNIIDAINFPQEILPVGRLDKDSEGLILLTNDKKIINQIIHPDFEHEKEYIVTVNMPLRNAVLKEMATGVNIGDAITKSCVVKTMPESKRMFKIILKQGLNRQIRKMCNVFGYQVLKLQRIRIMHIEIGKLKTGEWRHLTPEEIKLLKN